MKHPCFNAMRDGNVFLIAAFWAVSLGARPMDLRSPNPESTDVKRAPSLIVPIGAEHVLSRNCMVTSSTSAPTVGELTRVTDGNKEASENDADNMVKLGTGLQWVQLDLGTTQNVYGVCIWRHHHVPKIYMDVVIHLSNDPSFTNDITTVFNNDHDNSSGLGTGSDKEYIEWNMGRCIPVAGVPARYIRVYSGGYYLEGGIAAPDSGNYYTEIEVYGGSPTSDETILLKIDIPKPQFL
jgi:hypothetical protein